MIAAGSRQARPASVSAPLWTEPGPTGYLPCLPSPVFVIVMGASGSRKTTVAKGTADRMHWRFKEGDDLHSRANVEKMAHGEPLTDEDRWPWLDAIGHWLDGCAAAGESAVLTCSALRRTYR